MLSRLQPFQDIIVSQNIPKLDLLVPVNPVLLVQPQMFEAKNHFFFIPFGG